MFKLINISRIFSRSIQKYSKYHQRINVRFVSTEKYDPKLVDELTDRIESDKVYKDVYLENYHNLYCKDKDGLVKDKIQNIINIYETMKYGLDDVPSDISSTDMVNLIRIESTREIKKLLNIISRKESKQILRKKLKIITKAKRNEENVENFSSKERVNGIFDENNELSYGLWKNTLFTRIARSSKKMELYRHRLAEIFGQNLIIDMSLSSFVQESHARAVSDDIRRLLHYNLHFLKEPFRITFCGVDYKSLLWQLLEKSFDDYLQYTNHTSESYMNQFASEKKQLVYITGFETRKHLEYNPSSTYIMAGISERHMDRDIVRPVVRKYGIKSVGIPIDENVLWSVGSKRQTLMTRLKFLNDIRDNVSWKDTILRHVSSTRFKTLEEVQEEEQKRILRFNESKSKRFSKN